MNENNFAWVDMSELFEFVAAKDPSGTLVKRIDRFLASAAIRKCAYIVDGIAIFKNLEQARNAFNALGVQPNIKENYRGVKRKETRTN